MRLLHRNELDFIGLDIRTINLSKRYFESGAIQLLHIEEVEDPYGVYHDVSAVLEVHGHLNECSFRINDYMEIEKLWHLCSYRGCNPYDFINDI